MLNTASARFPRQSQVPCDITYRKHPFLDSPPKGSAKRAEIERLTCQLFKSFLTDAGAIVAEGFAIVPVYFVSTQQW